MKTVKEQIVEIAKDLSANITEDRADVLNVRPHVYFVNSAMLKGDLGASTKAIKEVHSHVNRVASSWVTKGIGGVERIGDTTLAYLVDRTHFEKGKVKKVDIFDSSALNNLHKDVVGILAHYNKELNTGNVQKGHFLSGVATEARVERLEDMASGGKYSNTALSHVESKMSTQRHKIYNDLRIAIQKKVKKRKLDVTLDMVHSYKGPGNELDGKFVVFVTPQSQDLNEGPLAKLEMEFGPALEKALLRNINQFGDITGSPTFIQRATKIIENAFIGKHGTIKEQIKKSISRYRTKKKASQSISITPKIKIERGGAFLEPQLPSVGRGEQIPSDLMALLNARLTMQVKDVMGDGTATDVLNWRTGRFGESARVTAVTAVKSNHIMVFYNYMKYPYQTFDPGYAKHRSDRRGPSSIIDQAVRELAAQLVYTKFVVTTRLQ